jgi:hypothetical protein
MMWSFDLGTGGLGQIPGLTRCTCVHVCVCVLHVRERIIHGGIGEPEQGSLGSLQMAISGRHSPTWLLDTGEYCPSL